MLIILKGLVNINKFTLLLNLVFRENTYSNMLPLHKQFLSTCTVHI